MATSTTSRRDTYRTGLHPFSGNAINVGLYLSQPRADKYRRRRHVHVQRPALLHRGNLGGRFVFSPNRLRHPLRVRQPPKPQKRSRRLRNGSNWGVQKQHEPRRVLLVRNHERRELLPLLCPPEDAIGLCRMPRRSRGRDRRNWLSQGGPSVRRPSGNCQHIHSCQALRRQSSSSRSFCAASFPSPCLPPACSLSGS